MTDVARPSENRATWWRVQTYAPTKIEPVAVVSCTDYTVVVAPTQYRREVRINRTSKTGGCFPTWTEAHAFALSITERRLSNARRELQQAQSEHGNVVGLKCPEGTW